MAEKKITNKELAQLSGIHPTSISKLKNVVLANAVGFSDLEEQFNSSKTQTTMIAPTSKDQCKDDGWKNYPQFKNQGQCVSFVNH